MQLQQVSKARINGSTVGNLALWGVLSATVPAIRASDTGCPAVSTEFQQYAYTIHGHHDIQSVSTVEP